MTDAGACEHPQETPGGVARELLDVLTVYRGEVDRLRAGWDDESYQRATEHFTRLRGMAGELPRVRTEWAEFLVTRFEFAHVLWQRRDEPLRAQSLHDAHERHASAIRKLHAVCSVVPRP